jgi:SAM-dependent methyltransferase
MINKAPPRNSEKVYNELLKYNNGRDVKILKTRLNITEYKNWIKKTKYSENYPKYLKEYPLGKPFQQKSIQHYLSIVFWDIKKDDIYLDVASSNSVFPNILQDVYKLPVVYKQDLKYPKGLHGSTIGGNADSISLPDQSVNHMAMHCSLEHFEYGADVGILREAARLLKPKGRLCIVPLYLSSTDFVVTSPSLWFNREPKTMPSFDEDSTVCISEHAKQRYIKHYSANSFIRKIALPFKDTFNISIYYFENFQEIDGCPEFSLILGKKDNVISCSN